MVARKLAIVVLSGGTYVYRNVVVNCSKLRDAKLPIKRGTHAIENSGVNVAICPRVKP